MKIIASVIVALLLPFSFASPVSAGGDCLNESEWDQIHDGLLKSSVHNIIGDNGRLYHEAFYDGAGYWREARAYKRCNGSGESIIGYKDYDGGDVVWRVAYKVR